MRMRYRELIGKEVIAADGERIGRIADLGAERQGDALRVTALLVGTSALLNHLLTPGGVMVLLEGTGPRR